MKITAINGSPKISGSVSGMIIRQLEQFLGEEARLYHAMSLVREPADPVTLREMLDADVLLAAFPLYVDGLPAPLVELLARLAGAAGETSAKPLVYAAVNCGFYETAHTAPALDMMRHFTERAGLAWGRGLGIGRGGMLGSMGDSWAHGPAHRVHGALLEMAAGMGRGESGPDVFTAPLFPRFLYMAGGNMNWRRLAKKNGVRKKLNERPYATTL